MSEPKRVNFSAVIVHHIGGEKEAVLRMYFENDGLFVSYEDYARLKAEVERLTAFTTRTIIPNEELQKQVERLTKAGDELHAFLINYIVESRISSAYLNKLDDGWLAAKEGKPRA